MGVILSNLGKKLGMGPHRLESRPLLCILLTLKTLSSMLRKGRPNTGKFIVHYIKYVLTSICYMLVKHSITQEIKCFFFGKVSQTDEN